MNNFFRSAATTFVLALVLGAGSAHAQQASPAAEKQALIVSAANRTAAAEAANGAARADALVRGGDVLRYQLTFTNVTDRPIRQVVLANPIPAGLRFVAGSVRASRDDARPEFSIDGGNTFSPQPMEEVIIDGKRVRRPASAERYTHVRWTVDGWVAPGATVTADFDARWGNAPRQASTAAAPAAAANRQ